MITNKITPEEESKIVNEEVQPTGDGARSERQEPGFTPGPWSLTNNGTYIRPDCLSGTVAKSVPGEIPSDPPVPAWPAICHVRPWPQDRWDCLGEAESRANARLIAAAPALYEIVAALGDRCTNMYAGQRCPLGFKDSKMWCLPCRAVAALALVDGPQTKETK